MSDQQVYVVPADGLLLRDEYTAVVIPPEGQLVKLTLLTQRRIARGELTQGEVPQASHATASTDEDGN